MAKRDRNMTKDTNETEAHADDDLEAGQPPAGATNTAPDDDNDEDFEFDMSLLPKELLKDVELEDLQPDFVRPEGFLMVPRLNPKTGVIHPMNTTFAGIVKDVVPWQDNRGKQRFWFSCVATATIPGVMFASQDEQGKDLPPKQVEAGMRIGISSSGAINQLTKKKGHLVYLHWTGNKVPVKNGAMWEIKAKVSKAPLPENAPF